MPFSYKDYTGDGSTTTFSITFDYQKESEISVTVDGVAQSGFTFPSSTQVQLTTAPAASTLVRIRRTTDLDSREVDFASGSVLTEEDLDNSNIQVFHAAQEAIDTSNDAISLDDDDKWDANSKVIKNVANPVNAQDAATKDYLENTWLTASDKAQLNALDTDNLDLVADDVANVNTVATNIADVNTVAARDADIDTVAARDADIGTVASRDADIGTVADRDADIGTVADRDADIGTVAARDADIGTVADDLDLASPKITTVANNITNVNTVAGVSSDVTTVAGISADVSAVEDIAANVTTVAGIDSDVSTVSSISTDVTTVADNDANVTTVAGNNANITTVAGISSDVTTVAGISADTTTVAGISANVTTVAGNNANVSTVAGISSDVTTVAGVAADVTTAATNIADITAVADEVNKVISVANDLAEATSEIDVVAGSIANVDTVGGAIANVNTVASNIADVNNFADTYAISATAPSSPTVGDLWFDTTNNVMKVYSSGGFINAGSAVNGTANRVSFVVGTSEGSYDGSTTVFPIEYDSGYIDVYLNGVKLTEDDFTATNGTSVTLNDAAISGDTFEAVGYGTFELSDFSIGDANNVDLTGLADDQFLQYNSTSGNFEPATIATDVSGDSTPQLGGDLDVNGNKITSASNADVKIDPNGTGDIQLNTGGVRRATVTSTGLGIGETSPSKALVISENDAEAAMIIKSSDTGIAALYFGDQSDEIIGGISYDNTNDKLQLRSSNNNVAVSINSAEHVGIGLADANNTLSIKGGAHQLDIETNDTGVTFESIDRAATGDLSDMSYYARHGRHRFYNGSYSEAVQIDNSGHIHAGKIYNGFDTTKNYNTAGNESSAVTSFTQVDYDSRGWWLVGIVGMHMPGSGGKRYIHCKTNLTSTSKMCTLRLEGYLYNAGIVSEDYGFYMYTGSSILNKWRIEKGSTTAGIYNVYKASGGELVIVIDCGTTGYTSAAARLYAQGPSSDDNSLTKDLRITSITRSTSTSSQY